MISHRSDRERAIASARGAPRAIMPTDSRIPAASESTRHCDRHAPAGLNTTTDNARPRLASSSASQPPSELPTTCARPTPAASRASSTPSASASIEGATPASNGTAPPWPSRVGAKTSWWLSRCGRTGVQARQFPPTPCSSTSGLPVPPRYPGVKAGGTLGVATRRFRSVSAAPAAANPVPTRNHVVLFTTPHPAFRGPEPCAATHDMLRSRSRRG